MCPLSVSILVSTSYPRPLALLTSLVSFIVACPQQLFSEMVTMIVFPCKVVYPGVTLSC